jgi:hypothetical protein
MSLMLFSMSCASAILMLSLPMEFASLSLEIIFKTHLESWGASFFLNL